MDTQITNENSFIRILTGDTSLLVNKSQIKTIDSVKNELVRIDIGEGALRQIYIKFADVTAPSGLGGADALRDAIRAMCDGATGDFSPMVGRLDSSLAKLDTLINSLDALAPKLDTNSSLLSDGMIALKNGLGMVAKQVSDSGDTLNTTLATLASAMDAMATNQDALLKNALALLGQIKDGLANTTDNFRDPIRIDESVPMEVYNGFILHSDTLTTPPAVTDPVWAIQRITRSGDTFIYDWANGNQKFINVWDNRYSLSYLPLLK